MKRALAGWALAMLGYAAVPAPAQTPPVAGLDGCLAEARSRADGVYGKGHSEDAARAALEIAAATCFDPSLPPVAAHAIGTVNADLARLAHNFVIGEISLAKYRAARKDRLRKLAALKSDPSLQRALTDGDADGDLVPDSTDHCPGTPRNSPTNVRGCPIRLPATPSDEREERPLRATLAGSRTLYNKSCEGAPRPDIPSPLEWGRGPQTKFGTMGFNHAVAKIAGQPAGCEIFYELQLRFIDANPGNPALPPAKIVTIVFSASEDLLTDPVRAVFGLPVGSMSLSPSRDVVREAFLRQYARAMWRVRAVNGSNRTSPWSPFVTQGPASGGVQG